MRNSNIVPSIAGILPASVRQAVYVVYAVALVVIGGIQVGYASAGVEVPLVVGVVTEVVTYLGIAVGATAASNIQPDLDGAEGQSRAV